MKKIKMCLYGEPGVGKSVFAVNAPKPFFICSDGNYAWLEDFGADPNAHADVQSWDEAKKPIEYDLDYLKANLKKVAIDGVVKQNPTLKLVLGTCPTLALTTLAMNGLGMGAAVTFVLSCSSTFSNLNS